MKDMTQALAFLAQVNAGGATDFLVLTTERQIAVLCMNTKRYSFRPSFDGDNNASVDVKLHGNKCVISGMPLGVDVIADLEGKIVMLKTRLCGCGQHGNLLIRIPKGCTIKCISLDGAHKVPTGHPLEALFGNIPIFGLGSGLDGLGLFSGIGRGVPGSPRTFYGLSGGLGAVFESLLNAQQRQGSPSNAGHSARSSSVPKAATAGTGASSNGDSHHANP